MTDTLTSTGSTSASFSRDSIVVATDSAGAPMAADTIRATEALPADSAFVCGILELPAEPPAAPEHERDGSLTGEILAIFSLLTTILLLKKIVNVFPSLIACVMRWKESFNLEASVKSGRDRDIIALGMFIPFCMIVEHYRLYSPAYMADLGETFRIAATAGTFVVYACTKMLAATVCKPKTTGTKAFAIGIKASGTFFILLALLLLGMAGVAGFLDLTPESVKPTMLCVSAAVYAVFLLRSFQIFASSVSHFTAFLYLCALEIVPTGLLVGSVFVF